MQDDDQTLPPKPQSEEQPTIAPATTRAGGAEKKFVRGDFPVLEGYEITDELGRGGMGVVYKARDNKLDRHVAIKMVLGGKFATEEDIQRFRIEGEAAARLDHPGIVPIYETGEVDGNHFFSMKFIEGKTLLQKLAHYKSDRHAACELIAKISDAVHHAHQRAVLHRDLKPANVLVDAAGQPAITDFGLAKRTDGDRELTQTGLVMGTPGFMSPEQAAGRKDVTAAADVFSLGAMLFWIITGEAPFRGDTGMETVIKTIECDVPSIRTLVPNADFDLTLLCMKAMHKDPEQRYSSAAEFSSDLRAWLEGEPLSVRRASAVSTASLWIRKNLRSVIGAVLAGVFCGLFMGGVLGLDQLRRMAVTEASLQQLSDTTETWVSRVLFLKDLSPQWQWIQFLMVPAIAACAFLCVLVVKPKTREVNFASGITAGFIAGAVALMLAGGWGLIGNGSIQSGARDIELLSTAMWLESDDERSMVQKAMLDRYPGLTEMSVSDRQQMIRQKILHQQRAGLTPDLWWGVLAATLFVGLPMALTCVLSGSLWRHGYRGWMWFGCTWERAAYLLVLFLILAIWFAPLKPATWLLVVSPVLLLMALYLAVSLSSWFWRIAVIPIPFVCMFMIQADFAALNGAMRDAGRATDDRELRVVLETSGRRLRQVDDSFSNYRTAIGWLYLGDESRYQEHCEKLTSNFDYAWQPGVASQFCKICMIRPDLHSPEILERAWELTEFASEFESEANIKWFQSTRALAEVRRRNFEEALEWNRRSRGEEKQDNGYRHAMTYAVDALALIGLGKEEEARKALADARLVHDRHREKNLTDGNDASWNDSLVFRILEKEVVQKLN